MGEQEAERRLREAAKKRDEGIAAVDLAVVETSSSISRRKAAEAIGRTPSRVQQIINEASRDLRPGRMEQ